MVELVAVMELVVVVVVPCHTTPQDEKLLHPIALLAFLCVHQKKLLNESSSSI
jgi:hypothetical protein